MFTLRSSIQRLSTGLAVRGETLTDAARADAGGELAAQVSELSGVTVDTMKQAGVLP